MHLFVNLLLVVENRKNLKLLPVDTKLQNIRVLLFWIQIHLNCALFKFPYRVTSSHLVDSIMEFTKIFSSVCVGGTTFYS